jgi:hypothetical protein
MKKRGKFHPFTQQNTTKSASERDHLIDLANNSTKPLQIYLKN